MVRLVLQQFWFLLIWVVMLSFERTWGLPLFSLTFVALQLTTLEFGTRVPVWIFMSLILASMYSLPLTLSAIVTLFLAGVLEIEQLPYKYKSKLFWALIVGVNAVLALVTMKQFPTSWLVWHLFLAGALFLFLKYWFERREYSRVTNRSRVFTWQRK